MQQNDEYINQSQKLVVCTACGSDNYKTASNSQGFSLTTPRECRDCGNIYNPPVSKTGATLIAAIGILISAVSPIVGLTMYFQFSDEFNGGSLGTMCLLACGLVSISGFIFFRLGVRELKNHQAK